MRLVVTVVMVAGVLATAVPALAQPFIVFLPGQPGIQPPGATFSCTDRPFNLPETCEFQQVGPPADLVCDIPTTVTIGRTGPFQAFECHAPEPTPEPTQEPTQEPDARQQQPGAAGGGAPITQEGEQEAESGDIDQSFDVSQTGDNSNQCAGVQGVSNTGNPQNVIDLLPALSEADDFEFEEVGSDITVSPESPTTCDQQVNQAASASG